MEENPTQPPIGNAEPAGPAANPPEIKPKHRIPTWLKFLAPAVVIIIAIVLSAGAYLSLNSNKQVACTTEAKLCPDGSSVGRTGPKCEFAKCPAAKPTPTIAPLDTSDWKTYANSKYNLSFKYPNDLNVTEGLNNISIGNINVKDVPKITFGDFTINPDSYPQCSPKTIEGTTCASAVKEFNLSTKEARIFNFGGGIDNAYTIVQIDNPKIEIKMFMAGAGLSKIWDGIISTFKFTDQTSPSPTGQNVTDNGCKIGGCGGELCQNVSDEPIVSNCIYKASFACYKTARCEIQQNGKCGWTQTTELTTCLSNSK